MSPSPSSAYSALVDMELHLPGGKVLGVAQCGPDFLILEHPCDLSPTEARLVLSVDGNITEHHVFLPSGSATDRKIVVLAKSPAPAELILV